MKRFGERPRTVLHVTIPESEAKTPHGGKRDPAQRGCLGSLRAGGSSSCRGQAGEKCDFFSIPLFLQFGMDRVEEGFHLKGFLKRAVGAQHFGNVEKI